MVDETTQTPATFAGNRRAGATVWLVWAVVLASVVLAPLVAVAWIAALPAENIWPHLLSTTLPRYLRNTVITMLSVGVITAVVGAGCAWLVTMYRFPFSRVLQWALFMPLAVPAFVGAFAVIDFLEYAGLVQISFCAVFGWETSRDYWFLEIGSRGMAIVVLSASLFPYVYLLARAAFREMSAASFDVARALGAEPWQRFWSIGLPLARPAIAAGAAIVMMETVNDFGTVDRFAVQTLTIGIFSVWLEQNNAGGASQIAMVVLILILVGLERGARSRAKTFCQTQRDRPIQPETLGGLLGFAAFVACLLPFLIGLVLPVCVISLNAFSGDGPWFSDRLVSALRNTVFAGTAAAVATVTAGVLLVYGVRLTQRAKAERMLPITSIG